MGSVRGVDGLLTFNISLKSEVEVERLLDKKMDREKEIIREMEELKEADIPQAEKWERILGLARELGRMILEKDQDLEK